MIGNGAVLRAVASFNLASQSVAQNVYHFTHETSTEQTEALVNAAILEFVEDAMAYLSANVSDQVDLSEVAVFERVGGLWEPTGTVVGTWSGGSGTERLPAGVALMIRLYKDRTGHADRKFIAGLTEGSVTGDTWSTGALSNAASFVVHMFSPYTATNGVELRAVHFKRSSGETAVYTGGVGAPTVSYQRRRKPGVGLT